MPEPITELLEPIPEEPVESSEPQYGFISAGVMVASAYGGKRKGPYKPQGKPKDRAPAKQKAEEGDKAYVPVEVPEG